MSLSADDNNAPTESGNYSKGFMDGIKKGWDEALNAVSNKINREIPKQLHSVDRIIDETRKDMKGFYL